MTAKVKDELNRIRLGLSVFLAVCFTSFNASAALVSFDDLPVGNYSNLLTYGNLTIRSQGGGQLHVTDQTADGYGNAHSLQNKLSVWGQEPLVPAEKTSFLFFFDIPVDTVSFWMTGLGHETTIHAFNVEGDLIDSFLQTYPVTEPMAPDGTPWDYYYDRVLRFVELEGQGISKVTVQPNAYDGFSIDDVNYSVVPEPATPFLVLMGLIGLFGSASARHGLRDR
jgi:hypothetical protein